MIKEVTQSYLGSTWYHSESPVPLIQKSVINCLGTVVGSQSLDRQTDIWREGETFEISNEILGLIIYKYLLDKILAIVQQQFYNK